jgi:hypothetical protein
MNQRKNRDMRCSNFGRVPYGLKLIKTCCTNDITRVDFDLLISPKPKYSVRVKNIVHPQMLFMARNLSISFSI